MRRTLFIGDIHGCIDELDELLRVLAPRDGDRLLFVGDLVDRGPDSIGAIERVRDLLARFPGSAAIAGNHEEKALRLRERGRSAELQPWAASACDDHWAFLDALPLIARVPDLGVLVVHGGLYPSYFERHGSIGEVGSDWRREKGKLADRRRRFLRVRTVSAKGEMVSLEDTTTPAVHWTAGYDGAEGFCFFGHDPQLDPPEPLVARHAIGIDTGCCFGGRLTAAVVEDGQNARAASFVSVAARAQYSRPYYFGGGPPPH